MFPSYLSHASLAIQFVSFWVHTGNTTLTFGQADRQRCCRVRVNKGDDVTEMLSTASAAAVRQARADVKQ